MSVLRKGELAPLINDADRTQLRCPECYSQGLVHGGKYQGRLVWRCKKCQRTTLYPFTSWPPTEEQLQFESRIRSYRKPKEERKQLKQNICKCGCGKKVEGEYARGHRNRVVRKGKTIEDILGEERAVKFKKSMSELGKIRYRDDPKTKEALSKGRNDLDIRARAKQTMKELCNTPEWRQRKAEVSRNFHQSERGKEHHQRVSIKVSEKKKQEWADPNHTYNTKEYRQSLSDGQKKVWKNPEYAIKWMRANAVKPNKQEIRLHKVIDKVCPKEFEYNGDQSLGILVGGKTPDFIHVNGRKQVIEFFGDWWHGEKRTGIPEAQAEQELLEHYQKYEFECLIIWERELDGRRRAALRRKIRGFVYG